MRWMLKIVGGLAGFVVLLVAGYLLGSIPFGLLITRAAGLGDIRSIGSGNIGATNVLRTGSKPLAAATLVLDALKATVAVLIAPDLLVMAQQAGGSGIAQADLVHAGVAGAYAAFLGHLYPVWLGFRGGRGIAGSVHRSRGCVRDLRRFRSGGRCSFHFSLFLRNEILPLV